MVDGWQDGGVNGGAIQELSLPYDPGRIVGMVERRRRRMRSRLISLAITVVVVVALYLWRRPELQGAGFFALYGLVLGVSLVWFAVLLIGYLLARRELAAAGSGVAVRIGPPGIEVAGLYAAWPEVASVAVVKGRLGRGPVLELTSTAGARATVALEQIVVFPATLDSTTRAFSSGRYGVDLSALDN